MNKPDFIADVQKWLTNSSGILPIQKKGVDTLMQDTAIFNANK